VVCGGDIVIVNDRRGQVIYKDGGWAIAFYDNSEIVSIASFHGDEVEVCHG
jgi:hypothetical protein